MRTFRIVTVHEIPVSGVDQSGLFVGTELERIEANNARGAILKFRRSSVCASKSNHPVVLALPAK